jgi:hypothetical protein
MSKLVMLQIPTEMLDKFTKQGLEVKKHYRSLKEQITDANERIYSAYSEVEDVHSEVEDAIETMEEVVKEIRDELWRQIEAAGIGKNDLRGENPDLYGMINSWSDVGSIESLDFNAEIDEPKLLIDLPFVQPETPAERELVKQIEMMQASATKLKACRQPPLRSKKDKEE